MGSPEKDFALQRFSTADLAARDRVPFWHDFWGEVVHSDVEIESDQPFHAEAELLAWTDLRVLWSKETPMRYSRSRAQAADGDDSLVFLIRQSGSSTVSQRGHDVLLAMGDGLGFLAAEPASAMVSEIKCLALVVPRAALTPLIGDVAGKTMRRIPRECDALRHLTNYANTLREGPAEMTPELRHLVATHIYDLIGMALGTTRGGAAIANCGGIRTARLMAIKADILTHIGSSELTVDAVAQRQCVTPRYVHMLFEAEGFTFSEFVRGKRLAHAHRMLSDSRFSRMSIAAIAFAAGFGDLSYFNRTFRRRFGAAPSDVRVRTAREPLA